jgi:peptidyl-prolyl cis-trans isomerase A (cyclophilin A)
MSIPWKLARTWPILALLLLSAGCGSQGGPAGDAPPQQSGTDAAASSPEKTSASSPDAKTPAADTDSRHPVVVIETSLGNITVKLDAEKADMTVENFLRYVEAGFYNNTIFHQVLKDYVILGGAYTPELVRKKTDGTILNEASAENKNLRGTVAMARRPDVIDSATSDFFINVKDNAALDQKSHGVAEQYGYCVFGEVTDGMDVVDRIANVPVHDTSEFERIPVQTVLIKTIRRVR